MKKTSKNLKITTNERMKKIEKFGEKAFASMEEIFQNDKNKNKKTKKTVKKKQKLKTKLEESEQKLAIANGTVCKQINELESIREYVEDLEKSNRGLEAFIQTQEKHLRIAEKEIERKDKQFYGLRAAYQDEIINRGE